MLRAYSFEYSPQDNLRSIKEAFVLQENQSIDKRFLKIDTSPSFQEVQKDSKDYVEAERNSYFVEYKLSANDQDILKTYSTSLWHRSQGFGIAALSLGIEGRIASYKEGIKNAIREYARKLIINKPKQIKGLLVLERVPRLWIIKGSYSSELRVRILLKEVIKYKLY